MTTSERARAGGRPRAAWLVLAIALATGPVAAEAWRYARPDHAWSFPRDHWAHEGYKTEWWYFTGQLASSDPPGRRFGYQFTLFRIAVLPAPPRLDSSWATDALVMGHAALTDLDSGEHRFSEALVRAVPALGGFSRHPAQPIAWLRAPAGTDAAWTLHWNGEGFDFEMRDDARAIAFALTTRPMKPLVLQGPGGFTPKGEGPTEASLYYSFTRLATEGALVVDGDRLRVSGESWMDKEFGSSQLAESQVGWDWFSLRLDDGRDLMLYLLRRADGADDWRSATIVDARGTPRYLPPHAWRRVATDTWTSPRTGARYPSSWTIEVPSENLWLRVVPEAADQENVARLSRGIVYWEGAVAVLSASGTKLGSGYVELTGYGHGNRPPL